ncbi:enoyl-[acyl-carrier-protein] reductase FabK [bacterium]|nr:enoyl-[acyl-carrier-protein] reductase FabK [bacterium]
MFRTRVCELLGIEYPILQGGMAWVATAELAAAVSEAGGLGIIGAGGMPGEILREEIRKARSLTNKPFGVNIMLMSEFVEEQMKVILEERPAVITTGAGNPGVYIPDLKSAGIKVIPVVASVALAIRLERIGVDALIAEGSESGGHIGEVSTFALLPQVVDAVSLPVIAAGGIADGRGFLAAFALGAEGVQMGTRFVCSTECTVHPAYKEAIIKARDRDTVVTGRPTGHPVRCIRNKLTRKFEELESRCAPPEELEELGRGRLRAAAVDGDVEYGSVMAGEISGLIKDIKPVKQIIQDIITEAEELLANLYKKYGERDA